MQPVETASAATRRIVRMSGQYVSRGQGLHRANDASPESGYTVKPASRRRARAMAQAATARSEPGVTPSPVIVTEP